MFPYLPFMEKGGASAKLSRGASERRPRLDTDGDTATDGRWMYPSRATSEAGEVN